MLENVHTKFENGNLTIDWTQVENSPTYKANLHNGRTTSKISGTKHTVEDILLYDSIFIDVHSDLSDPGWRRFVYKGTPF